MIAVLLLKVTEIIYPIFLYVSLNAIKILSAEIKLYLNKNYMF